MQAEHKQIILPIVKQGLWQQNPALVQMLGLCPLLAVSNTLANSLVLGLLTLAVLTAASGIVSLIRNFLDDITRLPAQILVIASFVTLADMLLQAYLFDIHDRIGLFVALIVTNCTLLARAESFACRNPLWVSLLDGFMMGLGFLMVLVVMGLLREALGAGTLFSHIHLILGHRAEGWSITLPNGQFLLLLLPPGAFLTLGCLIAAKNWIDIRNAASRRQNL